MTTAAAPKRRLRTAAQVDVPALITAAEAELATVFFEREVHIDVVFTAFLARQHGYGEGEPGTGKSLLLEACARVITSGRYARFQLDPYTGKEDLFGMQDLALFLAGGGWYRDTTNTAVDAHFILWDEVTRANGGLLSSMLSIQNEGFFMDGNRRIDAPVVSAWGAANDWLFDVNPALADRYMVHLGFDDLKEEASFAKMFAQASSGVRPPITSQIPLDALLHAADVEVPAVIIPAGVQESVRQLRSDLATEQIRLSPRRWYNTASLIKAAAYKRGKKVADEDDLAILQHALFQHQDQRAIVRNKVLALTSPITKAALELSAQLDEFSTEIDKRARKSVGERASYGADVSHNLDQIQKKVTKLTEDAHREQRNPAALQDVQTQIRALRLKVHTDCMNFPASTFNGNK